MAVHHLTLELEELNRKLLDMGSLVATAISRSVRALVDEDRGLAEQVIAGHRNVERLEMEVEGMATRLLALRQPVARDLRLLTAALKINTDLERIGELSVHVAERSISVVESSPGATAGRHSLHASLRWCNRC